MSATPLFDTLTTAANSLPAAEYRGALTIARFGSLRQEFAALSDGSAVYDLGFRGRISITGSDRVRWLNGMVSNNVRDLPPGQGVYSFLLNPQGRILGDMQIYNVGESIIVDTDRAQIEKLMAAFDHYIIMDDVQLADFKDKETAIGVGGPKSREMLRAAGIEIPELKPRQIGTPRCTCECACVECTVIRGDEAPGDYYEIWLAPALAGKTWQALLDAGAAPVGSVALETWRIASGIPLYGVDIRERDLPQETEQMRALNFNKGCYVGQEIVERIRSRGNVHRTFAGFQFEQQVKENSETVKPGSKILIGEKEVGEITSVADVPAASGERTIALGYIRREHSAPGHVVVIAGLPARVARSQFVNSFAPQASDSVLNSV